MLIIITILIQLFDVAIHIITDQVELLRIISNGVIIVGLFVALKGIRKFSAILAGTVAIYLILNIIFLSMEGIRNDGTIRWVLLLLMAGTILSTLTLIRRRRGSA